MSYHDLNPTMVKRLVHEASQEMIGKKVQISADTVDYIRALLMCEIRRVVEESKGQKITAPLIFAMGSRSPHWSSELKTISRIQKARAAAKAKRLADKAAAAEERAQLIAARKTQEEEDFIS